jgi:hypothetical protein
MLTISPAKVQRSEKGTTCWPMNQVGVSRSRLTRKDSSTTTNHMVPNRWRTLFLCYPDEQPSKLDQGADPLTLYGMSWRIQIYTKAKVLKYRYVSDYQTFFSETAKLLPLLYHSVQLCSRAEAQTASNTFLP